MPAKNIFIENTQEGKSERDWEKLNKHDFWNLAGRAGRLSKDLYGNVFLINYEKWIEKPKDDEREIDIEPALYSLLNTKCQEILNYINNETLTKEHFSDIQSVVNTLFTHYKQNKLDKLLKKSKKIDCKGQICEALKTLDSKISIPKDILNKNQGISVISQQKLYQYFANNQHRLPELKPLHPNHSDRSELKQNLIAIFHRIKKYFYPEELYKQESGKINATIVNAIMWMRGEPISLMISNYVKYKEDKAKNKNIKVNGAVRHILEQIEKTIRFEFAINIKCYIDILQYYCESIGQIIELEPIHLFLEMGGCNKTVISLMGIGLSRTSAIEIESNISNKDMNEELAIKWLKDNKCRFVEFGISFIATKEIDKII
jgi:hypothetical protein